MNPLKDTIVPIVERPTEHEPGVDDYAEISRSSRLEPNHIVWLRLLWEERRFLGRVTAYGLVLATLIALILPSRYESTVRLMPPDDQSTSGLAMTAMMAAKNSLGSMGGLGGSLAGAAGDLLGLKNSTALYMDMLHSRTVQDRMIQRFDLRKQYRERYWKDARKELAKRTDIVVDRKSDVTTLAVSDRDPHRAQQMAQAYVEELDHLLSEVSTSAARRQRIFIEQRLQTVKQDLDRTSKEFSEYQSQNTVLDMPYQAKAMVEAAAQLQGQLIVAQSELEGLEQIYTPSNIRVRSAKARVDELKSQLSKMSGTSGDQSQDFDAQSSASDLYPSIRKLPLLGVRWLDLFRESKTQETVYELLTQQYELAKIQEAKEIPTVKILDPGDLPEKRSFPPMILIILLGTMLAMCLGGVVVIGTACWKEVDPHSPEKQLVTEIWTWTRRRIVSATSQAAKPPTVLNRFWGKVGKQNGQGNEPD